MGYQGGGRLSWAVENSHEAVVALLLDNNADIEFKDANGSHGSVDPDLYISESFYFNRLDLFS
jgi:ankyrin repeat protein